MYRVLTFFVLVALFSGCEESPIEIPEFVPPESSKVVLIEEYTGVRCVNCPAGARELENLLSLYGENLVAVSVHTGFFADPYPESVYDFRTPEGDAIESYVGQVLGYPAASVDRKTYGSNEDAILDKIEWASRIQEELQSPAEVFLNIDHRYNEDTRQLEVTVVMKPVDQIDRQLRVGVMITESDIEDYQLDVDGKHSDYKHKHVLRDYLTDIKGDNLSSAPYLPEDTYTRTFTYTLPPENGWWIAENCHVLAFIAGGATDNKVIIQAAEVHLTEE